MTLTASINLILVPFELIKSSQIYIQYRQNNIESLNYKSRLKPETFPHPKPQKLLELDIGKCHLFCTLSREIFMTAVIFYNHKFIYYSFETSSSVMTFSTYELALHQNVQDRLRKEIEEVVEKYNGELTYEAIGEMKYLDMVFKETLRKYPILDNQNRKSTHDFKIPNSKLVIPAGTNIIIPSAALHNDERFWENPDKFDPERFTEENIKKRPPYVYIPFSEGGRMCIGYR